MPHAPTLTVHLSAIRKNYAFLKKQAAGSECAAVVKADAYGLGITPISKALWQEGARFFFVAQIEEALQLRKLLPKADIAVLNGLLPKADKLYIEHNIIPVLNDVGQWQQWNKHGHKHPAILHIDTGMNRLGVSIDDVKKLADTNNFPLLTIMSHLACADSPSHKLNDTQYRAFNTARKLFPKARASLANSAAILMDRCYHFDLVRPGCALYGINPRPKLPNPLKNVVDLRAPILQLHTVPKDGTVGYGATLNVKKGTRLATIGIGYADGLLRSLSNQSEVIIGKEPCLVLGRVSMDLIIADVTHLSERTLEKIHDAEIIGQHMPVDMVAAAAGTIGYEIFTRLGSRITRIYE